MFGDLVGSTALSARLDPEDMGEVIRAYQDAVAGEVDPLRGARRQVHGRRRARLLRLAAGARGRRRAGGPRRARGCAARSAGCRRRRGAPLAARVGIATGLVVVGDLVGEGAAQEEAVVGETPNLAARLQALAEPGAVVIAEARGGSWPACSSCADLGAARLKGFAEPVRGLAGARARAGPRAASRRCARRA